MRDQAGSGASPDAADRLTELAHELNSLIDGSLRWVSIAARALPRPDEATQEELDRIRDRLGTVQGALERMAALIAAAHPAGGSEGLARRAGIGASGSGAGAGVGAGASLGEAVDHAADVVRPGASASGVRVSVEIEAEAGRQPAGPLYSVALNGLRNGIESVERAGMDRGGGGSGDGDGGVRAGPGGAVTARLTMGRGRESGSVVLAIEDDGAGPPGGAGAGRVFEAGYGTNGPGRGHGLAISARIVRGLGGTIELYPGPGEPPRVGAVLRVVVAAERLGDGRAA